MAADVQARPGPAVPETVSGIIQMRAQIAGPSVMVHSFKERATKEPLRHQEPVSSG
jgi:hypothetical protein